MKYILVCVQFGYIPTEISALNMFSLMDNVFQIYFDSIFFSAEFVVSEVDKSDRWSLSNLIQKLSDFTGSDKNSSEVAGIPGIEFR